MNYRLLRHIFQEREAVSCRKAADSNDDGRVNILDAIGIVSQLFRGRDALPVPFPECGDDATEDQLSCEAFPSC